MKITAALILLTFLLAGCVEPNPAHRFVSKDLEENALPSVLDVTSGLEDLDSHTYRSIQRFGPLVRFYAHKYQVDWRLVMAVMKQESSFRPKVVSYKGAYGLMQIMPVTEAELTQKIGVRNARTPKNNIKAGIYHLKSLYNYFDSVTGDDRIRLTLAAYNAGLNRIRDAQDIARFMGDDPTSWKSVKDALPMLSRKFHTLHRRVWESGVPRSGYFSDVKQTVNYVETIMDVYSSYQLALR